MTNLLILVEQTTGFSGLFGYSPSVAQGNLVMSAAAVQSDDPDGNEYLPGFVTYKEQGGIFYACADTAAGLAFYTAPAAGGPWTQQGLISIDGFGNVFITGAGNIVFSSGSSTQPTQLQIPANEGLTVTGAAWVSPAPENGFGTSGLEYQQVPLMTGAVAFRGTVTMPATGSYIGVNAFQLPSPTFIPAAARRFPVVNVNTADVTGYGVLNTDGTVHFEGLPGSYNGQQVELNGVVWI
jgi:hypothetical protein